MSVKTSANTPCTRKSKKRASTLLGLTKSSLTSYAFRPFHCSYPRHSRVGFEEGISREIIVEFRLASVGTHTTVESAGRCHLAGEDVLHI